MNFLSLLEVWRGKVVDLWSTVFSLDTGLRRHDASGFGMVMDGYQRFSRFLVGCIKGCRPSVGDVSLDTGLRRYDELGVDMLILKFFQVQENKI